MFWIVVGVVLVVVLGLAWLADRKWEGIDPTPQHTQGRAQASSDQAWTSYQANNSGGA